MPDPVDVPLHDGAGPVQVQEEVNDREFPLFEKVPVNAVIVVVPPSDGKLTGRLLAVRVFPLNVPRTVMPVDGK